MGKTIFEQVVEDITKLHTSTVKKFTDEVKFPGEFEAGQRFQHCLDRLNDLDDWEKENPQIIGDEIMRLYTDVEDLGVEYRKHVRPTLSEEEEYVNTKIKKIMIKRNLLRKRDRIVWEIK